MPPMILSAPSAKNPYSGADPYWNNVSLLMHMDDPDFSDVLGNPISNVGAVQAAGRWGRTAASFPLGAQLSAPISEGLQLGTGDFTIECWFMPLYYVNSAHTLVSTVGATGVSFKLSLSSGFLMWSTGGVERTHVAQSTPVNTWTHLAVERTAGRYALYSNGVKLTSTTNAVTANLTATGTMLIGGGHNNLGRDWRMDDLRITKGVARYATDFYVPSAVFPNQ